MSLFKFIAGIGQGALNGGKMVRITNWVKTRDVYRRNMLPNTKTNALNLMGLFTNGMEVEEMV